MYKCKNIERSKEMKKTFMKTALIVIAVLLYSTRTCVAEDVLVEKSGSETQQAATEAKKVPAGPAFHVVVFKGADRETIKEILPLLTNQFFNISFYIMDISPEIPQDAFSQDRNKYYAGKIIDYLVTLKPKDSMGIIGYVKEMIFAGPSPSVDGVGLPDKGAAVVSHAILKDADHIRYRRRVLNESVHELGHVLGQEHCAHSYCVMSETHNLGQLDVRSVDFCPTHKEFLRKHLKSRAPEFFIPKTGTETKMGSEQQEKTEKKAEPPKDDQPPRLINMYPDEGALVSSQLGYIRARLEDQSGGAGIDPSSITLLLDGMQLFVNYSELTGELTARVSQLDPGPHTIELHVYDKAKNAMTPYFSSFTSE